jgi:transposase
MAAVMIVVDPHKASHTAVAISAAEQMLGELRVSASSRQAERLLAWAAAWPQLTWGIEGAGGLGHLLAQQLVAAGERVLDVHPRLGARVRLLATGTSTRTTPTTPAIAALRSPSCREVTADDHAAVLKVWSKRHRDLGRTRTQVACRLHAGTVRAGPGGVSRGLRAGHATRILAAIKPASAVDQARRDLAAGFVTCAASTASCAIPGASWRRRSAHRGRP